MIIKRAIIKISGEALAGRGDFGVDVETTIKIAQKIKEAHEANFEIGVVVGGGNIFRGRDIAAGGDERAAGDYIGMLATVINAMMLQIELEKIGVQTRVQTAITMQAVAEPFIRRKATHHLDKKRVVIFGAGTGLPFHSTDMAAVVRALEIGADVILKATLVDGVYSSDPNKDASAERLKHISFHDVRHQNLKVMDLPAVTLAEENHLPIRIFKLFGETSMKDVLESKGDYSEIA